MKQISRVAFVIPLCGEIAVDFLSLAAEIGGICIAL